MRDPKRLDRILALLKKRWLKNDDQRFGQMLINNGIVTDDYQTWSLEDDLLEEHLNKLENTDIDGKK